MQNFIRSHPYLGSSQDPNKLSLSVTGGLLTLVPLIVMIAGGFNITLDPDILAEFINTLLGIVTLGITLYGLGRKIIWAFKK